MEELSDKDRPKKLEDIFREGMEEAEMAPSDLLWSRIERDLNKKEAVRYKQRLQWYQRLAAACVVLLLIAGAYLFYDARQHQDNAVIAYQVAQQVNADSKSAKAPVTAPDRKAGKRTSEEPEVVAEVREDLAEKPGPGMPDLGSGNLKPVKPVRTSVSSTGQESSAVASLKAIAQPVNISANGTDQSHSSFNAGNSLQKSAAQLVVAQSGANSQSSDSLKSAKTWLGMNRLAVRKDSFPSQSLPLAGTSLALDNPEETKPKAASRWRFGGKYASQYFDQNIALAFKPNSLPANTLVPSSMLPYGSAGVSSYADALKEFEKETGSGFSFNTGLSAAYQLNPHFDLETGLGYTQNVAITNTSYIFFNRFLGSDSRSATAWGGDALNSSAATSMPATALVATLVGGSAMPNSAITKTQAFDTQYRYRLLGIPVKLSYQTNRDKSFYFVTMGMFANLLIQTQILSASDQVADLEYNPRSENSPFRNWHFAAVASAGRGFRLAPGLHLKAGLEATQYLTHLASNSKNLNTKQRKPYTIGLALSSSYTFGK